VNQPYLRVHQRINDSTMDISKPRFLEQILAPLWRVMPSPALYRRGLELQSRHGLSFYDALIVAAALEAGCTRLYTEDLQHGQKIEGLLIQNPFVD
jgi:predicted nucleic acid-binding protein